MSETYELKTHLPDATEPGEIQIEAQGERSLGGAMTCYLVTWPNRHKVRQGIWLDFVPNADGGLTNEALLAIVIDRLKGFDQGPFPSVENKHALHHAEWALNWLHARSKGRKDRGVEGLQQP